MPLISYIDGINRDVFLSADTVGESVHPIDLYKEMRELRRLDEGLRRFPLFMQAKGSDAKGGGKFTERYVVLLQGTRIIPYNVSHALTIVGTIITDDGQEGIACFDRSPLSTTTRVDINYQPPQVEIVRDEVSLAAISQMSFFGEIWHDHILGTTVAEHAALRRDPYLLGNSQYPASDHLEAVALADARKIKRFRYTGHHDLTDPVDLTGFQIRGDSAINDSVTIGDTPTMDRVEMSNLTVRGILDGAVTLRDCLVDGLTHLSGMLHQCALTPEPLVISGTDPTFLMSCYGYQIHPHSESVIDSNHSVSDIIVRDWEGALTLKNITQDIFITITFRGKVTIDASCTAGTYNFSGTGEVINNSVLDLDFSRVLNPSAIASDVWAHSSGVQVANDAAKSRKHQTNRAVISTNDRLVTIYDDDGTTILHQFDRSSDLRSRTPV